MTVVPFIPARRPRSSPLFVFADFQQEYVSPGRPYAIGGPDRWLDNCRGLLSQARASRLPIAHFRQLRNGPCFARHSAGSQWIEGFQPRTNEMLFERDQPSCYANPDFCAALEDMVNPAFVLVGPAADQACLGTAVEARRRGHRVFFLSDCSATAALGQIGERDSHDTVCRIISHYAEVLTVNQMMVQMIGMRVNNSVAV